MNYSGTLVRMFRPGIQGWPHIEPFDLQALTKPLDRQTLMYAPDRRLTFDFERRLAPHLLDKLHTDLFLMSAALIPLAFLTEEMP